jgi:hypothetical protein
MPWFALLLLLFPSQTIANVPPVGIIDFYGLKTVTERQARAALHFKEGDPAPESPVPARLRLEALPNVVKARLNFVCCDNNKTIVYVGIAEQGAPTLEFRAAPTGSAELPSDVVHAGQELDATFSAAIEAREFGEDDEQGHALSAYRPMRDVQTQLIRLAAVHMNQLRDVLHNSANAKQRALAAQVMGYAADKRDVIDDLVYAMHDPDDDVRNNAMRALWLIALLAERKPDLNIHVAPEPFIDMLNSIVWTDRNKSSLALYELTEKRDPALLAHIREKAMSSLLDMAHWKAIGHATPALFILGRMAGLSEDDIQAACDKNDRDKILSAVTKMGS